MIRSRTLISYGNIHVILGKHITIAIIRLASDFHEKIDLNRAIFSPKMRAPLLPKFLFSLQILLDSDFLTSAIF